MPYKLQDTETGLFYRDQYHFTKRGKVYATLGHLKAMLTNTAHRTALRELNDVMRAAKHPTTYLTYYQKYEMGRAAVEAEEAAWWNAHPEIADLNDLCHNTDRREELYRRYLPKTWSVVYIPDDESKEVKLW